MTRGRLGAALLLAVAIGVFPGLAPGEEAASVAAEAAPPAVDGAPVLDEDPDPAALAPPAPPAPVGRGLSEPDAIERAWFEPAESLEERVWRTRRNALERGVWNVEGPARSLLAEPNPSLDRVAAAVRLAPDLPAGRMALAREQWLQGESPLTALRSAGAALLAFARHPEGGLWLAGNLLQLLAAALMAGGALCLLVVGLGASTHAAHDLGDLVSRSMPSFGRAALLSALLALPLVGGEGLLGVVVLTTLVAAVYSRRPQRFALALAAAAVVAGAGPVARMAGAALEGLPGDPVARAALAASRGLPLDSELARLEAASATDPLAQQALAQLARRSGNLGRADALYQQLIARSPGDAVLLNNAANVRLHLGHMESAFELYRRALAVGPSPIVLYNLSQAYGRSFQVDDLTAALERAQALDGDRVADLTRLQGTQPEGFVVDMPIATLALWRRVVDLRGGGDFAAALRAPLAPGRLGGEPGQLAGAFAAALLAGGLLANVFRRSRRCPRCSGRVCPRCHVGSSGREVCVACHRLFYEPEQTDPALRLARVEALRARSARLDRLAGLAAVLVPGAAGALIQKPLRGLLGAVCFALALGALVWRDGVVPDPLVAGAAGPLALMGLALAAGFAYVAVVAAALARRRSL